MSEQGIGTEQAFDNEKRFADQTDEKKLLASKRAKEICRQNGGDLFETYKRLMIMEGSGDLISDEDLNNYLLTPFERDVVGQSAIQDLTRPNFESENTSQTQISEKQKGNSEEDQEKVA